MNARTCREEDLRPHGEREPAKFQAGERSDSRRPEKEERGAGQSELNGWQTPDSKRPLPVDLRGGKAAGQCAEKQDVNVGG